MFPFLLVVHAIVAAALVTVILMQRSEGGGLGMGGSPSGLMSARGAADFLTRATAVLAAMFVGFSVLLALLAANHHATTIDTSLAKRPPPVAQPQRTPDGAPFASGAQNAAAAAGPTAPADNSAVPIAR